MAIFCTPLLGVRLSDASLTARQAGLIRALTTPGGASTCCRRHQRGLSSALRGPRCCARAHSSPANPGGVP
eukprot:4258287-Alexandrium_andersonii.AAC.1